MSFLSDTTFADFIFFSKGSGYQYIISIFIILLAFISSYLVTKYIFPEIGKNVNLRKEKIFYLLGSISSIILGISPALVGYLKYKIGEWTEKGSSISFTTLFGWTEYIIYIIFLIILIKILLSEIEINEKKGKQIFIGGFIILSILIVGIMLEIIKIIT
ncbi:hypothetical protein KBD33_03180 [Candidatus Gracilibacteria bacterium]|nr:hypothetical protein [Candidatus Gracilibacteria bacterium]